MEFFPAFKLYFPISIPLIEKTEAVPFSMIEIVKIPLLGFG